MLLGISSLADLRRVGADWQAGAPDWALLAVLAALGAFYLIGVHRLMRHERRWPGWRLASFLGGLAVGEVALASGIVIDAHRSITVRVVQVLLLLDLVPTLLALGAPLSLLVEASPRPWRRLVQRAVASLPARALTHPVVVLVLFVASVYAYFLTPLYQLALEHPVLSAACDAEFLLAGGLFWWLAVARDRLPHQLSDPGRLLFLGVTIPPGSFLGIDLLNRLEPLAPALSLDDTHVAGAVLWGFADLYVLALLGVVYVRWMREEDARQLQGAGAASAVELAEQIVADAARDLSPPTEPR